VKAMKDKDFSTCRRWVVDNISNDVSIVYRKMYETLSQDTVMKKKSIPSLVLAIAKYSRDIEIVPDQEINMLACLTEIMYDCEFQ